MYLQEVRTSRTRDMLLPIMNTYCVDVALFDYDGSKAYGHLAEHVELEDCLHFPVNHSEDYVKVV